MLCHRCSSGECFVADVAFVYPSSKSVDDLLRSACWPTCGYFVTSSLVDTLPSCSSGGYFAIVVVLAALADILSPRLPRWFLWRMLCRRCCWKLVSSSLGEYFATEVGLLWWLPTALMSYVSGFSLLGFCGQGLCTFSCFPLCSCCSVCCVCLWDCRSNPRITNGSL